MTNNTKNKVYLVSACTIFISGHAAANDITTKQNANQSSVSLDIQIQNTEEERGTSRSDALVQKIVKQMILRRSSFDICDKGTGKCK